MSDALTAEPVQIRPRIVAGGWADPRETYEEHFTVEDGWSPVAMTISGGYAFVLEETHAKSGNSYCQIFGTRLPIGKHGCYCQSPVLSRAAAKQFLVCATLLWPGVERPALKENTV